MNKWDNIPLELRKRNQWAICKEDKIPRSRYGNPINVNDSTQWLSFDEAATCASEKGWNIGYILSADDPYSCIDLDVKDSSNCDDPSKWTPRSIIALHWSIIQGINSYTEVSISNRGAHIWVKGKVKSCRRDFVEIYSYARFIIMTGNVVVSKSIEHRQDMLTNMVSQMQANDEYESVELQEIDPVENDNIIIGRLMESDTSGKFTALACGNWNGYNYPSQSEADLALLAIICNFTESNEQARRIFRLTELGKRDKAIKNNYYLNRSLKQVRARQKVENDIISEVDFSDLIDSANNSNNLPVNNNTHILPEEFNVIPPASVTMAKASPISEIVANAPESPIDWPPGLAGRIAQFMYEASPRPIREVAIVSTLGFLAGICGKAYNASNTGLNLYIILIGQSAIGKESMHSCISALAAAMAAGGCSQIHNFLSFTDFVSGPALLKEVIQNPSICNIAGEWGQKLSQIALDENSKGSLASLRKEMTNLYQKSDSNSIVGGLAYSDKDKNIASVSGVAYSMIGETTPDTYYSSVTPLMMADGFMSRFLTIEYTGERPPLNRKPMMIPDLPLLESVMALTYSAHVLLSEKKFVAVQFTKEADNLLYNTFNEECDVIINNTKDEPRRQLWNRAGLKAIRIASLLAVADNCQFPMVNGDHAKWAIDVVMHGINSMLSRIGSGDVGADDGTRRRKLINVIKKFLAKKPIRKIPYKDNLYDAKIITWAYMSQSIGDGGSAFSNKQYGTNKLLDFTVTDLINIGILIELDRNTLRDKMGYNGRAFKIISTDFEEYDG